MDVLDRYFEAHKIDPLRASQADVVLGLLRINTSESLELASEVVGKPITRCPSAVPPWPPKPVPRRPPERKISWVDPVNPNLPSSDMFSQYEHVRRGRTEAQLTARGVTKRHLRIWTRQGSITWT